jgi:membrane-associated phospholipid phosphatase
MRWRVFVVAISQLLFISNAAVGQKDSVSHPSRDRVPARAWIVPVGIIAAAALDPEVREWAVNGHTRSLDHFAKSANGLGTSRHLVPAIALTYATALLMRHESFANGTLNAAAAYIASDLVESALKPMIGRERPSVEGNSHRFHPFTASGDWHSFPSAHVAHITSLAQAISMQTGSRPITIFCGTLVALVAWDRVYEDQHWTSDVVATAALSSVISDATVKWLDSHWPRSHDVEHNSR